MSLEIIENKTPDVCDSLHRQSDGDINRLPLPIVSDETGKQGTTEETITRLSPEHGEVQLLYDALPKSIQSQYNKRIEILKIKNKFSDDDLLEKTHAIIMKLHASYLAKREKCRATGKAQRDALRDKQLQKLKPVTPNFVKQNETPTEELHINEAPTEELQSNYVKQSEPHNYVKQSEPQQKQYTPQRFSEKNNLQYKKNTDSSAMSLFLLGFA